MPITNTLAVLNPTKKKKKRERESRNRDKSISFAYGPYHPDAVSLLKVFLNLLLEKKKRGEQGRVRFELQLWLNLLRQPSGEVASGNLFSHRSGLQALPNTDNW